MRAPSNRRFLFTDAFKECDIMVEHHMEIGFQRFFEEVIMAEKANEKGVDLTPMERQWVAKALEVLRGQLIRARGKERVGSEIHALRGREIDEVIVLQQKFQ